MIFARVNWEQPDRIVDTMPTLAIRPCSPKEEVMKGLSEYCMLTMIMSTKETMNSLHRSAWKMDGWHAVSLTGRT
jgi:hypothetical protein